VELCRSFASGDSEIGAVQEVSLTVENGQLVAVTGPSGSGKSTLLHLLGALDRPNSGYVRIEGALISELPERDLALLRRRRLGFLLQSFSLLPTLTALENVAFPLLLDRVPNAKEQAKESLAGLGLGHRMDHRPAHLSGGEQQRVALGRALVTQPAVVLADEPTGSLDSASGRRMLQLLRQAADAGQAIVIATHDADAAAYADRVVSLTDGQLAEC
jgi:putative ABC transport system ATP-binding protein